MKAVRLSVKDMMIAVGLIGILFGALRFHVSVGSFLFGGIAMAAIRTSEKLGQLRTQGSSICDLDRYWLFGQSLVIASVLLAASMLPGIYLLFRLLPNMFPMGCCRIGPSIDPAVGIPALAALGLPISVALRRLLW